MSSISIQIQNKKKPSQLSTLAHKCHFRAVGKSENPEVPVLFGGHNLPTLVEIGLTDLPNGQHPCCLFVLHEISLVILEDKYK